MMSQRRPRYVGVLLVLVALLLVLPLLPPRQFGQADVASAQAATPRFRPLGGNGPGTLPLLLPQGVQVQDALAAEAQPFAQPQAVAACFDNINNSAMTDFNGDGFVDRYRNNAEEGSANDEGWWVDQGEVHADTTIYRSSPNAIRMEDDPDGEGVNMISHEMAMRPSDGDISINFHLYLTDEDPGYDFLYYGFATFDEDDAIDELIYWDLVPSLAPERWHAIYQRIDDPLVVDELKTVALTETVWFVLFSDTDGEAPYVSALIDDVQVTTCATGAGLRGALTAAPADESGQPQGAEVALAYRSAAEQPYTILRTQKTAAGGTYNFGGLRPLRAAESYRVFYLNDGRNDQRLRVWAGPTVTSLAVDQETALPSFDIRNVPLQSPANDAQVAFPAQFRWSGRGLPNEQYSFCLYDLDRSDEQYCLEPQTTTSVEVTLADMEMIPELGFRYGKRFAWFVLVEQGDYWGASFYEHGVTFTQNPVQMPGAGPSPSGRAPSATGDKDWTVMVYLAGDNDLGDLTRYTNASANLQGQFDTLRRLAPTVPNVHVVVLADFFDSSGTRLCHMQPDGQAACQQLGEQNTADPAVLRNFIDTALERFPARQRMLIIANHGHSLGGVALDETTGPNAWMKPNQFREALATSRLATQPLDILFFSACLMGSVETAAMVQGYSRYLVASADLMWMLSVHERMLPLLGNADTRDNPRAVASGIVDAYRRSVQAVNQSLSISSAAYDLAQFETLNTHLSQLAVALLDGVGNNANADAVRAAINRARNTMQVYDASGNKQLDVAEDAFVDLTDMARLLAEIPNTPPTPEVTAIRTAAQNLRTLLANVGGANAFIVASVQASGANYDLSRAAGVHVFFPNANVGALERGQQRGMTALYLNQGLFTPYHTTTQWDEWISRYTGVVNTGSVAAGPGGFVAGVRPVSGAFTQQYDVFLPLVQR